MKHNPLILTFAAAMGVVALSAGAETLCSGASEPVRVDQTAGTRMARLTETIAYSPAWYSTEDGLTATVKIDGGATLVNAATVGDTYAWTTPTEIGTYVLKHETYQGGMLKDTLTATFEVPKGPTVQIGRVAQRYPWDGKIDVEYKVSDAPAGYRAYKLTLTATLPDGTSMSETVDNVKNGIGSACIDGKNPAFKNRKLDKVKVTAKCEPQN